MSRRGRRRSADVQQIVAWIFTRSSGRGDKRQWHADTPRWQWTPATALDRPCYATLDDPSRHQLTGNPGRPGQSAAIDTATAEPTAVDKVAHHQFDRNGTHVWRQAETLLEAERARLAIGQVSVPYGTCTEPTNVQAGGSACPFRFR
jgi:hypothetical protein